MKTLEQFWHWAENDCIAQDRFMKMSSNGGPLSEEAQEAMDQAMHVLSLRLSSEDLAAHPDLYPQLKALSIAILSAWEGIPEEFKGRPEATIVTYPDGSKVTFAKVDNRPGPPDLPRRKAPDTLAPLNFLNEWCVDADTKHLIVHGSLNASHTDQLQWMRMAVRRLYDCGVDINTVVYTIADPRFGFYKYLRRFKAQPSFIASLFCDAQEGRIFCDGRVGSSPAGNGA